MVKGYVHTIGDSTLDNLYWMLDDDNLQEAKKTCIEGQLESKFQHENYQVISHAYDGFTTKSVLEGDRIGTVLPGGQSKQIYCQEKGGFGSYVHPLNQLKNRVSESPDVSHYVVISVGGNDFRVNLSRPIHLLKEIPQIKKRLIQVVQEVSKLKNVKPILMLQYKTDAKNDHYLVYTVFKTIGIAMLVLKALSLAVLATAVFLAAAKASLVAAGILFTSGALGLFLTSRILPFSATIKILTGKRVGMVMLECLMQSFYRPVLNAAIKERIPVLDLSNTFDPYKNLYTCGIEPNGEGGALVAEGVHHVVKHHDFTGKSKFYAKPQGEAKYIGTEINPNDWYVKHSDPHFG